VNRVPHETEAAPDGMFWSGVAFSLATVMKAWMYGVPSDAL
jgi:hypothetical protein